MSELRLPNLPEYRPWRQGTPRVQPPEQGALSNLWNSIALDTVIGQLTQEAHHAITSPTFEPDPDYSLLTDPQMKGREYLFPTLVGRTFSADETAHYLERFDKNDQRRYELEQGGASWSRFFAQFADPVNYLPLPTLRGMGLMRGTAMGAATIGGMNLGYEGMVQSMDPTRPADEFMLNVAFGTIIGAGLGGFAGLLKAPRRPDPGSAVGPIEDRVAARSNRPVVNDVDADVSSGLPPVRTGEAPTARDVSADLPVAGRTVDDMGRNLMSAMRGQRGQPEVLSDVLGDVAPSIMRHVDQADGVGRNPELHAMLGRVVDEVEQRVRVARAEGMEAQVEAGTEVLSLLNNTRGQDDLVDLSSLTPDELLALKRSTDELHAQSGEKAGQSGALPSDFVSELDESLGLPLRDEQLRRVQRAEEAANKLHDEVAAKQNKLSDAEDALSDLIRGGAHKSEIEAQREFVDLLKRELEELEGEQGRLSAELADENELLRRVTDQADTSVTELAPGSGAGFVRTSQAPYYVLKNNRLGMVSQRLASRVRYIADMLAAPIGLRTKGEVAGVARAQPVESRALLHRGPKRAATLRINKAYMDLMGRDVSVETAGRAVALERVRQSGLMLAEKFPNRVRAMLRMAPNPEAWRKGKPTWDEFQELVSMQIGAPNSEWMNHLPSEWLPKIEEAARAGRDFLDYMDKHARETQTYASHQRAQQRFDDFTRQVQRTEENIQLDQRRIAEYNDKYGISGFDQWAEMKARALMEEQGVKPVHVTMRGRAVIETPFTAEDFAAWYHGYIKDVSRGMDERLTNLADMRYQLDVEKGNLDRLAEESPVANQRSFFPHIYINENIEKDIALDSPEFLAEANGNYTNAKSDLRRKLFNWFKAHPKDIEQNAMPRELGIDPNSDEAIAARVEETILNMLRLAKTQDEIAVDSARIDAKLRDRIVELATKLRDARTLDQYATVPPFREVEGFHLPEEELAKLFDGDVPLAYMRYLPDGGTVIHYDWARAKQRWDAMPDGADWKGVFSSFDELKKHIIEHERAHTRREKFEGESIAAYEARINREASISMFEGSPDSATTAALRRELELAKRKLTRYRETGETIGLGPHVRQRHLDLPFEDLAPYLELNYEKATEQYTRRMAVNIEMSRTFGDAMGADMISKLREEIDEAIKYAATPEQRGELVREREKVMAAVSNLRDMVRGTYGFEKHPTAWDERIRRISTGMKNLSILTFMGRPLLAAFSDVGMLVFTQGFGPVLRGMWSRFSHGADPASAVRLGADEARLAGLADEMASNMRASMMNSVEEIRGRTSRVEEMLQNNAARMFVMNGLSYWTDTMRGFASHIVIHNLLKATEAMARGRPSSKHRAELAAAGISAPMAHRIYRAWRNAHGTSKAFSHDKLYLANTQLWSDTTALMAFRSALAMGVNSAIVAPTAASRLLFMSKSIWSLLFQYKNFGIAATAQIMMAGAQRVAQNPGDMAVYNGLLSMIALSWMVDQLKTPDWAEMDPDEQILRAVERSGVLGVFGDLNSMLEGVSGGQIGLRGLLQQDMMVREPTPTDRIGALAGPAVGQWANLIYALWSEEATGDQQARAMRYMIPYNNFLLWHGVVSDGQHALGNYLESTR